MNPVRVIAVTGGKGGVGKTNISVNLSLALCQRRKRVMLLDADLGLANIDVVLGLHPQFDLSHVLRGEKELHEILVQGPFDLKVVPGASGIKEMTNLSPAQHAGLIHAFGQLAEDLDVLVIDTAAGISDAVMSFSRAAQEVVVVVCDEPASITDAYAIIKLLNKEHGLRKFQILANMVSNPQEARQLYNKMCRVTDKYLDVALHYFGGIPYDQSVKSAVKKQQPVLSAFPNAQSSKAFRALAQGVESWPMPTGASGQLQFFFERLVQYTTGQEPVGAHT